MGLVGKLLPQRDYRQLLSSMQSASSHLVHNLNLPGQKAFPNQPLNASSVYDFSLE
jgi:hypothetical protein